MSKNIIVDGQTLNNVTVIKAKSADGEGYIPFVDTSDADATAADISEGKTAYVNGEKLTGTNTGTVGNDYAGLIDGSITDFVVPNGITKIIPNLFYRSKNLKSVDFGAVENIGSSAFYSCVNVEYSGELSATITYIDDYGLYEFGYSKRDYTFVFQPNELCTLGDYALASTNITDLVGKFVFGGVNALRNCQKLKNIDIECESLNVGSFDQCRAAETIKIKMNGKISASTFRFAISVKNIQFTDDSTITELGQTCFAIFGRLGHSKESPLVIDFTKCNAVFNNVGVEAFKGENSTVPNKYMIIRFPSTVVQISNRAFNYMNDCEYYFNTPNPPSLSNDAWNYSNNYKIFVPYNSINAYMTAQFWSRQSAYIIGYTPARAFNVQDVLPKINKEGYELTWYKDKECTQVADHVQMSGYFTAEYYCIAGAEQMYFNIVINNQYCYVTVRDSEGKEYVTGDKVKKGTILTVTSAPDTTGYVPYLAVVNGIDYVEESTIEVSSDLNIAVAYWNGVDAPLTTFNNTAWSFVRFAFRAGIASRYWAVGDVRTEVIDNISYTIRICDMTVGRYDLADGSGKTNGVFEFAELYNSYNLNGTSDWKINSTKKEGEWTGGGYAMSDMANIYLPQIFDKLPKDLQNAISEIKLNEYSYTMPSPRAGNHKLFLPAETELSSKSYSAEDGSAGCQRYKLFEYYANNSTATARVKKVVGNSSSNSYWLRSPVKNSALSFALIDYRGANANSYSYNAAGTISLTFAI